MAIFKCKMCGGALEINNNETVATCEYCGTQQTLPKLDDDRRANLYDRANHFRRNNEFDKAMGIYEQILNEDNTDAEAYWSLVLCRYGIEYVEDPSSHKRMPTVNRAQFTSIFDDDNYKSALQYADGYQRSIYEEEAKAINGIQKGILAISQKEEPFDVFICYKETDNNGRRTPDSVLANDLYHQLIIPNGKYKDAIALMDAGKHEEAIAAFEILDGYKDSRTKIDECNTAILDIKYNNAIALLNAGNIVEAYEALIVLDGYKDSADKASSIHANYEVEKLKVAKTGDYVFFGTYEQDNDTSNGKEAIEWLVLKVKDDKVLLISKYALDCQQYNTSNTDVTWETCTLRKWLNNNFINSAFTADEKAMIPTVTVSANKNPSYSTNPGNATQDQVFLLSITEANQYFSYYYSPTRQCKPTEYAVANGVYVYSSNDNCWWWLRSPGRYQDHAAYVRDYGDVNEYGNGVDRDIGAVRPALWIDLNS